MKQFKIIVPVIAAILLCGCSRENNLAEEFNSPAVSVSTSETAQTADENVLGSDMLKCRYYDENDFLLYDSRGEKYPVDGELLFGVVPPPYGGAYDIGVFQDCRREPFRR